MEDKIHQIEVIVASGRSMEYFGEQLNIVDIHELEEQVLDSYLSKLSMRINDNVVNGILKYVSRTLGFILPIDNVDKLQEDLQNDYIIVQEVRQLGGYMNLKLGKIMALLSGIFHVSNHLNFKPKEELAQEHKEELAQEPK